MTEIVVTPDMRTVPVVVIPAPRTPVEVSVPEHEITVHTPYGGPPGGPGPPGPSGTTVVALEYNDWPPVNPQPNTLYLRLAP